MADELISSQAKKLGIKAGLRVVIDKAPAGWQLTEPYPEIVTASTSPAADIIISFFTSSNQLPQRLPKLAERIKPAGAIWVAWPRRANGHTSDITDNIVRQYVAPLGLVDVKVASLDDDWSALRIVWRLNNR